MAEQVKQAAGSDIDGAVDFVGSSLTGNSVQWCLRKVSYTYSIQWCLRKVSYTYSEYTVVFA